MRSDVPPGDYEVTCHSCGAVGTVEVLGRIRGKIRIRDLLPHAEGCPVGIGQPAHLRRRGWVAQERAANQLVGARATPASGAVGMDGDGRLFGAWRVESKQTEKGSYRIPQKVWEILVSGALRAGEEPLLHVQVRTPMRRILRIGVLRRSFFEDLSPGGVAPQTSKSGEVRADDAFPKVLSALYPEAVALFTEHLERLLESREAPDA